MNKTTQLVMQTMTKDQIGFNYDWLNSVFDVSKQAIHKRKLQLLSSEMFTLNNGVFYLKDKMPVYHHINQSLRDLMGCAKFKLSPETLNYIREKAGFQHHIKLHKYDWKPDHKTGKLKFKKSFGETQTWFLSSSEIKVLAQQWKKHNEHISNSVKNLYKMANSKTKKKELQSVADLWRNHKIKIAWRKNMLFKTMNKNARIDHMADWLCEKYKIKRSKSIDILRKMDKKVFKMSWKKQKELLKAEMPKQKIKKKKAIYNNVLLKNTALADYKTKKSYKKHVTMKTSHTTPQQTPQYVVTRLTKQQKQTQHTVMKPQPQQACNSDNNQAMRQAGYCHGINR